MSIDRMALVLADAYEAGILHHNFSPGNIIITDDGTG
jgi:RIO-like serine/threonine protein kinase